MKPAYDSHPNDVLIHIAGIFDVSTDYLLEVERKREIDFSGLTPEETDALINLIKAMRQKGDTIFRLFQEVILYKICRIN